MNISELARILKINPNDLREHLPKLGFDIGKKAIKIDNFTANKIIRNWGTLSRRIPKETIDAGRAELIVKPAVDKVSVPAFTTVKDFAAMLKLPLNRLLSELMKNNVFTSLNEKIDFETAAIIGADLGVEVSLLEEDAVEESGSAQDKIRATMSEGNAAEHMSRPPVVVIMGHVDHGKTKLLDTIRHSNVVESEAGGITQHIGAYQIVHNDQAVTFIDTPGHEAFTAMRNRGAKVADIAVLVVAADDGVKPQTVEAYRIIEAAKLPFIVAINKIDKPEANLDKVKQELSTQLNITPEDWGGKTIVVPLSAKTGDGVKELLDMLLLVSEVVAEGLKADPKLPAVGTIIESRLDKGEGPIATVLVQNGTLRIGDPISFNNLACGKVRSLKDHSGKSVDSAVPGMPVKLNGLKFVPEVGDVLEVGEGERVKQKGRSLSSQNASASNDSDEASSGPAINLIVKSDTLGSGEAIENSISKIDTQGVRVKIISKGLGNITEGDIVRAETNNAMIVGFSVRLAPSAEELARDKKITVSLYKIIYDLINDIKVKVQELVKPDIERVDLGRIKVAAIFRTEHKLQILGGRVLDGVIKVNTKLEVKRGDDIISSGVLAGLQSGKQDVPEVQENQECGLRFEGAPIVEVGDILLCYEEKETIKKVG